MNFRFLFCGNSYLISHHPGLSSRICLISLIFTLVLTAGIGVTIQKTWESRDAHLISQDGYNMDPTIRNGQLLFADRADFIDRRDLVLAEIPHKKDSLLIGRVIGLPGEKILIEPDGSIWVDGTFLLEPYLFHPVTSATYTCPKDAQYRDFTLKAQQYFILGDNRFNALDSRTYGPFEKSQVLASIHLTGPGDLLLIGLRLMGLLVLIPFIFYQVLTWVLISSASRILMRKELQQALLQNSEFQKGERRL